MFEKIVGSIGNFSYKNRKLLSVFAAILFIAVLITSTQLVIEYSYAEENIVNEMVPQDDMLVIVYENKDEEKIKDVIAYLERDERIASVQAYANTLGLELAPSDLADLVGIPVEFVNTLFYICQNGMEASGMTIVDFASFISSDEFLNNELFASMIDDEMKAQVVQLKTLVDAIASEKEYTAEEISAMIGVDAQLVQSIFFIAQLRDANVSNITPMFWANVANALGMDAETIQTIFNIQPVRSLKFSEFVYIVSEVAKYADGIIEPEQAEQLAMLKDVTDMITDGRIVTPDELAGMLSNVADSDMLNGDTLTLLCVMAESNTVDMSAVRIPLYDLFMFLSEEIMPNEAFASFFDEEIVSQFDEASALVEEGLSLLIADDYARMLVNLSYEPESKEIYEFYANFNEMLESTLSGEYYLIGMTALSDEVSKTFEHEYLIISVVTAVAVFAVVWFTFRKFLLAMLLIGVIECAVFSMMSVMVVINLPMYFVPLILVQCILMGSMIDYGILFTTYYIEVRKEYNVEDALPEVMRRSTHSILTSSLLIVLVTLISGRFMSGAVASILTTLGIGSLCAILLILFVLPSLLVIFDKQVVKQRKGADGIDEFDIPKKSEEIADIEASVKSEAIDAPEALAAPEASL